MSSATSDMDDEDTTVLSADSHPYLSLSSERPHSVDSSVHSRHGRSARCRPQTAPSLEAVVNSSCDRASNPESLQASGFSIAVRSKKPGSAVSRRGEGSNSMSRRPAKPVSSRGRIKVDVTNSGGRFPLKTPVGVRVPLNNRRSKSLRSECFESNDDNEYSLLAKEVSIDISNVEDSGIKNCSDTKSGHESSNIATPEPAPLEPRIISEFVDNDPHNINYSNTRKNGHSSLSEADAGALRLGRLVLSTVLNQPEISVPDAISRFFVDTWLSKNGSNISKADGWSVSLMSNLQRAFTEYDPGVDAGAVEAASRQKTVAAIACETLDTLIQAFGEANPVLYDIREALLPLIFMHPPELKPFTSKPDAGAILNGKRYIQSKTWCEDGAVIVEELRNTEHSLMVERKKSETVSSEISQMVDKLDVLQEESKRSISDMHKMKADLAQSESNCKNLLQKFEKASEELEKEREKSQGACSKLDKERKAHLADTVKLSSLKSKLDKSIKENKELTDMKTKLKSDIKLLNKNLNSAQDSCEVLRRGLSASKENEKDLNIKLEKEISSRQNREAKDRKVLEEINKLVGNDSNSIMSDKMKRKVSNGGSAVEILDAWKDELVSKVKQLEGDVVAIAESVKKESEEKMKKALAAYQREIQDLNASHSDKILLLKEDHQKELSELESSFADHRKDGLDLMMEKSMLEKSLQEAEEKVASLTEKFDEEISDKSGRLRNANLENQLLKDRLGIWSEDHMMEKSLREAQMTNVGLNEKVFYLVKSIEDLNAEITKLKQENLTSKGEADDVGSELLEAHNSLCEKNDIIKDLELQLEELKKPKALEIKLKKEIASLEGKIVEFEEKQSELYFLLSDEKEVKEKWQREFDKASLLHEEWWVIRNARDERAAERAAEEAKTVEGLILDKDRAIDTIAQRMTVCEGQLMSAEDAAVSRNSELSCLVENRDALLEEKSNLQSSLTRLDEANRKQASELEQASQECSKLGSQLDTERSSWQSVHEELQSRLNEANECLLMQSQEVEFYCFQEADRKLRISELLAEKNEPVGMVATDEKSSQTEEAVVFAGNPRNKNKRSSESSSESFVVSSGDQSGKRATSIHTQASKKASASSAPKLGPNEKKRNAKGSSKTVISRSLSTQPKRSQNAKTSNAIRRAESSSDASHTGDDASLSSSQSLSSRSQASGRQSLGRAPLSAARGRGSEDRAAATVKKSLVGPNLFDTHSVEGESAPSCSPESSRENQLPKTDHPAGMNKNTVVSNNHLKSAEWKATEISRNKEKSSLTKTKPPKDDLKNEDGDAKGGDDDDDDVDSLALSESNSFVGDRKNQRLQDFVAEHRVNTAEAVHVELPAVSCMSFDDDITDDEAVRSSHSVDNGDIEAPVSIERAASISTRRQVSSSDNSVKLPAEEKSSGESLASLSTSRPYSRKLAPNEANIGTTPEEECKDLDRDLKKSQPANTALHEDTALHETKQSNRRIRFNDDHEQAVKEKKVDTSIRKREFQRGISDATDSNALLELDNQYDKLFDMSIAFASSQQYIFDIIGMREKRSLDRTSRFKILHREANALVTRIDEKVSRLSTCLLHSKSEEVAELDGLLHDIRSEISENRWIFEMRNLDYLQHCPLKDAIEVTSKLIQSTGLDEDLEVLSNAEPVMFDKGCAYGIRTLTEKLRDMKMKLEESIHKQCGDNLYDKVLYREDGSVDTELDIDIIKSPSEKIDILLKINEQLRKDKSSIQKHLSDELEVLRNMTKTRGELLEASNQSNDSLRKQNELLSRSTVHVDSYNALRAALLDCIHFLSSLVEGNSLSSTLSRPSSKSNLASRLKSKVHDASNQSVSVYGNPGLLWRKILKKRRMEKAALIRKGHLGPQQQVELDISSTGSVEPQSSAADMDAGKEDDLLLADLSAVCNDLAQRLLFPSASLDRGSQSLSFSAEGGDLFPPEMNDSVSRVEVSPSLFEYSVSLNKNLNHHIDEARRLSKEKEDLLENNEDPSLQAERYYAAQNIFMTRNPENVSKWSESFKQGSGSAVAEMLVKSNQRGQDGSYCDSNTEGEFPIIERKRLISADATTNRRTQQRQPFLGSYKSNLKESDIPLLTKKVLK